MNSAEFRKIVYTHYKKHGRKLPWRNTTNFYKILVSEIMLQQTQVDRVIPKYKEFLKKFPTMKKLARAELVEVLRAWQGLGYNRRALWLYEAAQSLIKHPSSHKATKDELNSLKGIGSNTAASICAFAYNMPVVFIETNIRTVFLKYFFPHRKNVHDKEILKLVKKTLDRKNPRMWYWALMDLGAHIKQIEGNLNKVQSANYAKQSKFEGSKRQLRGEILKEFLKNNSSHKKLAKQFSQDTRFKKVFRDLLHEGLL